MTVFYFLKPLAHGGLGESSKVHRVQEQQRRGSPAAHVHWWREVWAKDYSDKTANTVTGTDGSLLLLHSVIHPPSLPSVSGCIVVA